MSLRLVFPLSLMGLLYGASAFAQSPFTPISSGSDTAEEDTAPLRDAAPAPTRREPTPVAEPEPEPEPVVAPAPEPEPVVAPEREPEPVVTPEPIPVVEEPRAETVAPRPEPEREPVVVEAPAEADPFDPTPTRPEPRPSERPAPATPRDTSPVAVTDRHACDRPGDPNACWTLAAQLAEAGEHGRAAGAYALFSTFYPDDRRADAAQSYAIELTPMIVPNY